VRGARVLTLMEAIRKMSLMPAQRLQDRVPMMRDKGRIRVGADADLTLFNPETVIDTSTYDEPAKYSKGIRYVLVNGVPVVRDGALEAVTPGRAVRAPVP
jgi:N-acyl-D-aspartate/D-glutamate deacylase